MENTTLVVVQKMFKHLIDTIQEICAPVKPEPNDKPLVIMIGILLVFITIQVITVQLGQTCFATNDLAR
jgi:hypothetical protein